MIPAFDDATEALPLGRYAATPAEVEAELVDAARFAASATRRAVFDDWLLAKAMIDDLSPDLIECAWIGGSFVTGRMDPDDMDSLFVISQAAFEALGSNTKRNKLRQFNKKDWLRTKTGLRVESFIMVRHRHAQPWAKDGAVQEAIRPDFALRGAWDDWWLRVRRGGKHDPPTIEEADPVRGYLEVHWP